MTVTIENEKQCEINVVAQSDLVYLVFPVERRISNQSLAVNYIPVQAKEEMLASMPELQPYLQHSFRLIYTVGTSAVVSRSEPCIPLIIETFMSISTLSAANETV